MCINIYMQQTCQQVNISTESDLLYVYAFHSHGHNPQKTQPVQWLRTRMRNKNRLVKQVMKFKLTLRNHQATSKIVNSLQMIQKNMMMQKKTKQLSFV